VGFSIEDKYEMQDLIELAGTWARIAAASQLTSGPSFISSPQAADEMRALTCQSALDRDPVSASKRDPLVLRFERLAFAPSELAGVAETGRARVDV
jgi:hypothetical protein